MRCLLLLPLLFTTLCQAVEVKFQKRAKDGTSVLGISGRIEDSQRLPNLIFKNKTRIVISSPGGNPYGVRSLVDWLVRELPEHPGTPQVIMRSHCSSSCLLLLAELNKLARGAYIELILDDDLSLGFHGCADSQTKKYDRSCTQRMIEYQLIQGVSREWILQHLELYARPQMAYIVRLKASDPRLKKSGLINHASIQANTLRLTQ